MLRLLAPISVALLVLACAPGTSADGTTSGSGGNGFTTGSGGGEGGAGGVPQGCMGIAETADLKPLHLYIMVDASQSMAGAKWDAARAGMEAFVGAASAEGIDVALSFFPRPPDAVPDCDQDAYRAPRVPYGLLPQNGPALLAAIDAEAPPGGFSSPMYPALGGAILESIQVALSNPDDVTAVLLVTDGAPDGPGSSCAGVNPSDPQEVANLAASGFAFDPPVATFVVGLPGVDQTSANLIAASGGTDTAIVVSSTDTAVKFEEALEKVRGKALACIYDIPADVANGQVGVGYVNVSITPGGGTAETLTYDPSCAGEGWRFDDPAMPSSILLCEATCTAIVEDPIAAIQIILGCPTVS